MQFQVRSEMTNKRKEKKSIFKQQYFFKMEKNSYVVKVESFRCLNSVVSNRIGDAFYMEEGKMDVNESLDQNQY